MRFPVLLIWDVYPGNLIPNPNFFHPGSQNPDPNFFHPRSLIPDPNFSHHRWKKEFKYFNPKNGFNTLRNMIRVFHPGSWSWIPDPGSRCPKGTGSLIWIHNTGDFGFALAVGGSVGYWLSTGAAVLTTHSMDQLSEAFLCKKEFSVYFIKTNL